MKGSNKSRWAAVLVVAIVAGAAYWFWQGREAANSGAPSLNTTACVGSSDSGSRPSAPLVTTTKFVVLGDGQIRE